MPNLGLTLSGVIRACARTNDAEKQWDTTDDEAPDHQEQHRARGSASVEAERRAKAMAAIRLRPPSRRSNGNENGTPQPGQAMAPLRYPESEEDSGSELTRLIGEVAKQNEAADHGQKMMHMVARGHSFAVRIYAARRSGMWRMCTIVPRNWKGENVAGRGLTLRFRCGKKKRNVPRGRVQPYDARKVDRQHTMDEGEAAIIWRRPGLDEGGAKAPQQAARAPTEGAGEVVT